MILFQLKKCGEKELTKNEVIVVIIENEEDL